MEITLYRKFVLFEMPSFSSIATMNIHAVHFSGVATNIKDGPLQSLWWKWLCISGLYMPNTSNFIPLKLVLNQNKRFKVG